MSPPASCRVCSLTGRTMSSARSRSATSRSRPSRGVSGGHGGVGDSGTHAGVPMLSPSAGVDSWLSLAPVNPDQEVQGEIHLELRVPERSHPRVLRCHLIQARLGGWQLRGAATTTGSYFWQEGGEEGMGTAVARGLSSPFHAGKGPRCTRLGTSVMPTHVWRCHGGSVGNALPSLLGTGGQKCHRVPGVGPQPCGRLSYQVFALRVQNWGKLRHGPGCPSGFGGVRVCTRVCVCV